jgi:translation initiation factor 2 gamma subunit (eIF-2gamma)
MVENTGREKQKNSEKSLSQCHFVHHISHMHCPGHELLSGVVVNITT